jgi:hypothetical protein
MFALGLLVGSKLPVGGKLLVGGKRREDPGVERREVLVVFLQLSSGDVATLLLVDVRRREHVASLLLVDVRRRELGLLGVENPDLPSSSSRPEVALSNLDNAIESRLQLWGGVD